MDVKQLKNAVDTAAGRNAAELVLKNALYLDVFSAELKMADIAINEGKIAGVGKYSGEREIDMTDKGVVIPGLIDAHMHLESSQISPEEFASLAVPRGTTLIIADPHEIVNVCGLAGADYIRQAAARTPMEVKLMLPSCVPATAFETSGAVLTSKDTDEALKGDRFYGLGEMMNYPGVVAGDEETLRKLLAAKSRGKLIDGHAPSLTGEALNAYIYAGARADHECTTKEEALEKIAKGMYVLMPAGSAAKNLPRLAPAVNEYNFRRFALCTDDRHAGDLAVEGHMDHVLRTAVKCGIKGEIAVVMCTLNAAECYKLDGKGAIAPGYDADLAVFSDLEEFECRQVYKAGRLVAEEGRPLFVPVKRVPGYVKNTVHIDLVKPDIFRISLNGAKARTIQPTRGSLTTKCVVCDVQSADGDVVIKGSDLVKIAVVERHFASGKVGLGLMKGYGLKGGAIATTVAHDSHNIIVAGDSNEDMAAAVEEIKRIGGGMIVIKEGNAYSVPLDIAGLMSSKPASEHAALTEKLSETAYSMGVDRGLDAFMTLSFAALAVIPEIRVTDEGLFDVNKFAFTSIDAD